jgi:hypothetical protein
MNNIEASEKRDYVRVPFKGNVTFRILTEDEFQAQYQEKENWSENTNRGLISENFDDAKKAGESTVDPNLVRFLLHLEDKLDRILGLLGEIPSCPALLNSARFCSAMAQTSA